MLRLALYQPEIAGNVGAIMRLCACMDTELHIIEPCGFIFDDKRLKRAGMDYIDHLAWKRHASWSAFVAWKDGLPTPARLLLLTTKATQAYSDFTYADGDILLFGQESAGAPQTVHDGADARLTIPLNPAVRSLNLGMAAAMALGEMRRQLVRDGLRNSL